MLFALLLTKSLEWMLLSVLLSADGAVCACDVYETGCGWVGGGRKGGVRKEGGKEGAREISCLNSS